MTDELKKDLESIAQQAKEVADEHCEGCPVGQAFQDLSDAAASNAADVGMRGDGPAQVSTSRYRSNWETIFGKRGVTGTG